MKRLLLVGPAGHDRSELKNFLQASGYKVLESQPPLPDPDDDAHGNPDLILLDHEADDATRLAIRSELRTDDRRSGVPVVEMCLTRPELYPAAAQVLDRVSATNTARRRRHRD
jgi:CheY-like chemotaxis protein